VSVEGTVPAEWYLEVKAERDRLAEALQEARPYVFNRTQGDDWRGETARSVLGRVDAALAALEEK
jgi:hypothetical protein